MPRACSVCEHEARPEIDKALASGGSIREVAGHWQLSRSAVERHSKAHRATVPHAAPGVTAVATGTATAAAEPEPEPTPLERVEAECERRRQAVLALHAAQASAVGADALLARFAQERVADGRDVLAPLTAAEREALRDADEWARWLPYRLRAANAAWAEANDRRVEVKRAVLAAQYASAHAELQAHRALEPEIMRQRAEAKRALPWGAPTEGWKPPCLLQWEERKRELEHLVHDLTRELRKVTPKIGGTR